MQKMKKYSLTAEITLNICLESRHLFDCKRFPKYNLGTNRKERCE